MWTYALKKNTTFRHQLHTETHSSPPYVCLLLKQTHQAVIQLLHSAKCDNPPVQNESMRDVDPFQISGIVLWYAEKVQVVPLLLITDLE